MFVSEFTVLDAVKLHKVYKHAVKKREGEKEKDREHHQHDKNEVCCIINRFYSVPGHWRL